MLNQVHTDSDTESECPLRLSATRSRSILRAEPQCCSPSWLSNTHTHTRLCFSFCLRSMAVRCVHGYRASTPVVNGDHGTSGISVWLIDRLLQRHQYHIDMCVWVCACVWEREYIFSWIPGSVFVHACVSVFPCGLSAPHLPICFSVPVHHNAFRRANGGK